MNLVSSAPKVSVCVITYNHERFIEPCLRSVLDQQAPFEFEVLVADDASTDRTGAIISTLASTHPRLKVLRRRKNLGPTQNYIAVHNEARGEFVAQLDGDDLAAPGKLVSQVSVLAANPRLVACGHGMRIIDERGASRPFSYPASLSKTFNLNKIIRVGMPFFSSSIMYRRVHRSITKADSELLDWYLLTDLLRHGDAGYISRPLGSYRVNNSNSQTALLGQEKMNRLAAEHRLLRLAEWPERRAEFFANALKVAVVSLARGIPITAGTRRLLRQSITARAVWPVIDAALWTVQNTRRRCCR